MSKSLPLPVRLNSDGRSRVSDGSSKGSGSAAVKIKTTRLRKRRKHRNEIRILSKGSEEGESSQSALSSRRCTHRKAISADDVGSRVSRLLFSAFES